MQGDLVSLFLYRTWLFLHFASCQLTRFNAEIRILPLHPISFVFFFFSEIAFMKSSQVYLVIPTLSSNGFLSSQNRSKETGGPYSCSLSSVSVSCRQSWSWEFSKMLVLHLSWICLLFLELRQDSVTYNSEGQSFSFYIPIKDGITLATFQAWSMIVT